MRLKRTNVLATKSLKFLKVINIWEGVPYHKSNRGILGQLIVVKTLNLEMINRLSDTFLSFSILYATAADWNHRF